jgi:hypothetical protein
LGRERRVGHDKTSEHQQHSRKCMGSRMRVVKGAPRASQSDGAEQEEKGRATSKINATVQ